MSGGLAAGPQDFIFGVEYPAIRWLEQNGYNVNYISGVDTARAGAQLLNSQVFLSVGHDEYWSGDQRANVEAARDAGVNLAFWSGNEVYWKTRWETSIDGSGTPYRTLVTYKETWALGDIDPREHDLDLARPRLRSGPAGELADRHDVHCQFVSPGHDDNSLRALQFPLLEQHRRRDLQPGQVYSLTQNLLGYEWDFRRRQRLSAGRFDQPFVHYTSRSSRSYLTTVPLPAMGLQRTP